MCSERRTLHDHGNPDDNLYRSYQFPENKLSLWLGPHWYKRMCSERRSQHDHGNPDDNLHTVQHLFPGMRNLSLECHWCMYTSSTPLHGGVHMECQPYVPSIAPHTILDHQH